MSSTIQQLLHNLHNQTPSRDLIAPVIKKIRYQKMLPYFTILGVLTITLIASIYNISLSAVGGEIYILRSIIQDQSISMVHLVDTFSLLQMSLPWQQVLITIFTAIASIVYFYFFLSFRKSMIMKNIPMKGGEHI